MSLTYGYDLKKGDKMLEAAEITSKLLKPVLKPGGSLVNHLPFCAASVFIPVMQVVSHSIFQCTIFLHGYHTSATNHRRK
jgi:hypothetical protein